MNVKAIDAMVNKWKEVGLVQDQFKGNAGREKSARIQKNQTKINSLVASNKKTSIGRLAFAAGMIKTCVHNILRKCLHLTPYKPQTSQELE